MAMRKSRRGPRGAAERVEGLLVMLPWLISRKRVKLSDMAKQFKLSEKELMNDLMMAAMCGVPPYTPDALIDVFVDEGEVVARGRTTIFVVSDFDVVIRKDADASAVGLVVLIELSEILAIGVFLA
jgi:hypothetical protein